MQKDPSLYLNRDYAYWQRIASAHGAAAVLTEWGNPKCQSRNPKIGRTLQDALDTVEAFRPRLKRRDVAAVFKLYEKADARDIRNIPITAVSGIHGTTSQDDEDLDNDFSKPPDTPESLESSEFLDVQNLNSELESKKQESKKLGSTKSESKKVKFNEFVEKWSTQPPQRSPNDSPVTSMRTNKPVNESPSHEHT
ncbi:hypothetical protein MMC27_003171 [Xylographa pallens]|nr:hypothetical protein [Xylographa pallens]